MKTERVSVLMGGPSSEHDVSLMSGAQIAEALEAGWTVRRVRIEQNGTWIFADQACESLGSALDRLAAEADVVFPALHGTFGEDGTIQAILETLGLPYVGSGVMASALAMDKARAKRIYQAEGLPTPEFGHLAPGDRDQVEEAVAKTFPCVVKRSASGSSCGVSFPKSPEQAAKDVLGHLDAGLDVVLEAVVEGRELTCGVVDFEAGPQALPVTEIVPSAEYAFFDYSAKYTPGATAEITPAEIDEQLRDEIQGHAVAAHRALGCRDMSRTDFMLENGRPTILETNTLPGFTPTSLLPQAAAAVGLSFGALVDHLVNRALARRPHR